MSNQKRQNVTHDYKVLLYTMFTQRQLDDISSYTMHMMIVQHTEDLLYDQVEETLTTIIIMCMPTVIVKLAVLCESIVSHN